MNITSPSGSLDLRGEDPTGYGYFGASRGTRKHRGLDLITTPGQNVMAPITGKITKFGYVYANALQFRYIEISGPVYRMRLLYCELSKNFNVGDFCEINTVIGKAQDIATYHGHGMINHLHWSVWKHGLLTDPEPLIICINNEIIP